MAIKCIKQLKRDDLTDNYEKYVKSGMSEYDAGIKVAAEYHRELFDEVADFRATVLGEDAAKAKAGYVPFDSTEIDKKYKTIASDRQAEQARVVAEQAKTKAEAEAKAEAARIKAETPKIKIEQKPKVESTTLKSEPEVKTETKPKIPIRQKPLTQIEAKGDKVYNKVEFAPKATVKDSLTVEKPTDGKATLPPMGDNYLRPLSDFAPTLYRDANVDKTLDLLLHAGKDETPFFANTPNLAKGQGQNTGILIELSSDGLQGQVNLSKPGSDLAYQNGEAEFVGKYNKRYDDNIQKVTISNKAKQSRKARALIDTLQTRGFTKTVGADNSIVLTRETQAQSDTTTYTDTVTGRTGTLETMPNGTQRIRLREAKVGSPMDGTTAMSARWKPTSEPMESARDTSSEPFYSALERTIEQKMPERASADQVKGIIRETKQEERDWLGIDQYLAENPRVSKADLLEFIRGNQVQVEEVMLGEKYEPNSKAKPLIEELRTLRQKDSPTSADTQRISDLYSEIGEVDPDYFVEKDSKEWSANPTKFSQWVLPGGENYKELLLVMPAKSSIPDSAYRVDEMTYDDGAVRYFAVTHWSRSSAKKTRAEAETELARMRPLYDKINVDNASFKSSHFDEPNILAHIRFDDRTVDGKKVLHIAEIQSDWHQAGRKKGYVSKVDADVELTAESIDDRPALENGQSRGFAVKTADGTFVTNVIAPADTTITAEDAIKEARRRITEQRRSTALPQMVPDAPFKKSWQELAFKKALRYAVENGYDAVSWDTGETNADRFDLSKRLSAIEIRKNGDTYVLNAYDLQGNDAVQDEGFTKDTLAEAVGKDLAEKIVTDFEGSQEEVDQLEAKRLPLWNEIKALIKQDVPFNHPQLVKLQEQKEAIDARIDEIKPPTEKVYDGLDLKVGGEGMKGFYDKILPTFVNKYVKKWGGKVEPIIVGKPEYVKEYSGVPVEEVQRYIKQNALSDKLAPAHSVTITPAMRDSVMEGQPMFRSREEMEASKESFEAAKKLPIEELLAIADPKKITHEDGVIDMADVAEYELVRRVMGNAFGKTGMAAVFQEPSVAQKFIETARDLATQANEAGVDGTKFTELANVVEEATKANGTAIFYIDESDLGEEKAHRSLYMLRQGDRPTQVPKSDLDTFVAEPIVQKALSGKFGKLYKNKSKAAQMEEFAVKAARGQWGDLDITSEGDKRAAAQVAINYLAKFAETNAKEGQTKDQLLKQLAQEIVYGEEARDIQETYESESRPSVQSTENLNKQVADGGQGKTVSGEQYKPSGETRLSQTPISAREKANIPLKDEQYVSASNAEQQEFADRQLAKGADSAMDWFKSQVADNNLNNGATGVVGLNLANHYGMQGDYAKMNEVAELLVPAITEAAQSVQAMRVLSKFDPKMALTYAATRKMKATNKPLTDREIRRLNPKIEKLANAENDKNVTQNAVENLKQGIANADSVSQGLQTALIDATKPTTADPTTVRKQVEASRKQSRPRPKKADRAEIEARIRAAFITEVMESAREDFGNDKYQDLIDLIALDILDYKTPAETYNHIQLLTGEAITPEQFVELQLDGWRASKAEKDFTPTENLTAEQREARDERIARRTARLAHQRMAFGTQGKKAGPPKPDKVSLALGSPKGAKSGNPKLGPQKPNRIDLALGGNRGEKAGPPSLNQFDVAVREQGIDRGYSDIEIVGAILMPKLSGTKATEDWYKQMKAAYPDTDVDTFARSYELRQSVLENVQEQRMLARAEKAGYEKDLPKFENEVRHQNRLVREAKGDLDNEYRKLQRGWRDVALTGAAEAMGLFKGLTSWGEISYILRQGFIPLLTDTRAAIRGDWQGVGHGLQGDNALWKWAAEKGGFEDVAQYLNDHSLSMFVEKIRQHPRFLEAQNNGVRFTQIGDFNIADDHFSTKMLEWIPMYKRAEVAYTLPGDLQRLFIYDSWAKGLDELGLTKEELKKAKRYAAETANAFTGKGDIAKVLARGGTLSKLANITWFSPQLLISRFQSAYRLSTGFATAPKGMKFQMAKKGLRFYGAIGVLMYLAGAVLDPEDDDFGKVNIKKDSWLASKIPDARDFHIDMLSGLDLPIQNGLRLMFGVGKSVYNQDIAYAGDAKDAIWNEMVANKSGEARLFRSKLSPGASLLVDIGKGTDFLGRPTTAWGAFTSRALPLAWQQTYDALLYDRLQSMQREPQTRENAKVKLSNEQKYDNALLMMLGTFVGVGITQYPKDDPSKAMQLTRQLSTATSSKDAETKRTEGALRNLYKAQQEALRANEPVERINREIQSYMNKYPALRKEQNDLLSQAKSQTGLFSYYAKDVSLDGLLRIRKVAEGAELEVVNKLIKAAEKKKR